MIFKSKLFYGLKKYFHIKYRLNHIYILKISKKIKLRAFKRRINDIIFPLVFKLFIKKFNIINPLSSLDRAYIPTTTLSGGVDYVR